LLIIKTAEEQSNEEVFNWNDRKRCKNEEPIEGRGSVILI
jgi:hypothetical protein